MWGVGTTQMGEKSGRPLPESESDRVSTLGPALGGRPSVEGKDRVRREGGPGAVGFGNCPLNRPFSFPERATKVYESV